MSQQPRVVYDCNILLQAMAAPNGSAGKCVQLVLAREVRLFLCAEIVAELRDVASRPRVIAKLKLDAARVDAFVAGLELASTILEGFEKPFTYDRDPDDAVYVNLALGADAKLIVSRDKDLLDLMDSTTPAGRKFCDRFPSLRILLPIQFLEELKST